MEEICDHSQNFFSKILICKFQESEENIDSNYNWYYARNEEDSMKDDHIELYTILKTNFFI